MNKQAIIDSIVRDEQHVVLFQDGLDLVASDAVEVVVEATGHPAAGIRHARAAAQAGKHIVMVNVEADVVAGPLLAQKAADAGVVYSPNRCGGWLG